MTRGAFGADFCRRAGWWERPSRSPALYRSRLSARSIRLIPIPIQTPLRSRDLGQYPPRSIDRDYITPQGTSFRLGSAGARRG